MALRIPSLALIATGIAGVAIAAASQIAGGTAPAAQPVARPQADARPAIVRPRLVSAPAPRPTPVAGAVAADPQAYVIKRVLPIDGPMKFGEFHWNEDGVPQGPLVVTVDLKAETMSVFRDGYEIGAAVILYGSDEKPTPTGVYPITQKKVRHTSNIYGAEMPYMQRLTDDGITIHASDVRVGYATHGCIGIPTEFAKKLFGATRVGDRVIVTNGEMLKQGQAITAA